MNFEEGLEVLGITLETDKREARRAYLRKVKVHKPEQDPVGFQRVRQAWEVVEGQIEWRRSFLDARREVHERASSSEFAPQEPPDSQQSDPPTNQLLLAETAPRSAPSDGGVPFHQTDAEPPEEQSALDTPNFNPAFDEGPNEDRETSDENWLNESFRSLSEAPETEFDDVAVSVIDHAPHSQEVWNLFWELEGVVTEEQLARFLRAAAARYSEFEHAVAQYTGRQGTEEELAQAHAAGEVNWTALASIHLDSGRTIEAADAVEHALADGEDLHPGVVHRILYALEAGGNFVISQNLFVQWNRHTEIHPDVRSHDIQASLNQVLLRDYFAAAIHMTPGARMMMGSCIADENWEELRPRLASWKKGDGKERADDRVSAKRSLRAFGKKLLDVAFDGKEAPAVVTQETPKRNGGFSSFGVLWAVGMVVLQLVRCAGSSSDEDKARSLEYQQLADQIALEKSAPAPEDSALPSTEGNAHAPLTHLLVPAIRIPDGSVAIAHAQLIQAVVDDDCALALLSLQTLNDRIVTFTDTQPDTFRSEPSLVQAHIELADFGMQVRTLCAPPSPTPPAQEPPGAPSPQPTPEPLVPPTPFSSKPSKVKNP